MTLHSFAMHNGIFLAGQVHNDMKYRLQKCFYSIQWQHIIAFLIFFVKGMVFYGQLHLNGFEWIFSIATVGIIALVCAIVSLFSQKSGRVVFWILYTLAALIMTIDSTYYAYASKLPSVMQLGMVGQLGDVWDSIYILLGWRQLFPLMDLPLWFLFVVNRRKLPCVQGTVPNKPVHRWRKSAVFFLTAILALLAVIPGGIAKQFLPEYMENELFCYHIYDVISMLRQKTTERTVDKENYRYVAQTDGEYWGIAEDRNVIIIQLEAFQNFVIGAEYNGQELTPFLNSLLKTDTIYFENYYYQIGGGNTADAEFAVNNSLFAPEKSAAYVQYTDNDYYGLPWLLKDNGYSGAHVFHNYKGDFWNRRIAYDAQGFDTYIALEDFEEIDPFPMGISDKELFRQSMEHLLTYEEPFYAFYITVSSHHPYAIPLKDREIVLKEEDEETLFGLYMQAVNYVDRAIESFVTQLKEAGLYDNTILVIYGDHYALTNTDEQIAAQVKDVIGRDYTIFDTFNVPCIVHIPGSNVAETISTAGGHMDLLPTLLHVLGVEKTVNVTFGQNLLTADHGFVCEQTHVSIGSFISDDIFFQKPHNNLLTNYRVYRKDTMEILNPTAYMDMSAMAAARIEDCAVLMERNDLRLP